MLGGGGLFVFVFTKEGGNAISTGHGDITPHTGDGCSGRATSRGCRARAASTPAPGQPGQPGQPQFCKGNILFLYVGKAAEPLLVPESAGGPTELPPPPPHGLDLCPQEAPAPSRPSAPSVTTTTSSEMPNPHKLLKPDCFPHYFCFDVS